ncbi:DNA recombination protein RmuC [uncultured Faecalibaculum sp.]|uniref:DNA recombination protein RmuC n=1 Tax=uncultured Faecalibaculum sp. TaxID=1729681 RepID=UPI0026086AC8|nr:DNA recombination protein RmuC [uncultured Faecalibaculum sp.]
MSLEWVIIALLAAVILFLILDRRRPVSGSPAEYDALRQDLAQLKQGQSMSGKSLDWMLETVNDMSRIMNRAKTRGMWGEYQMELLLENYAGTMGRIWDRQVTLANGRIADAALLLPGSRQVLCVDSKFPMDNFLRMDEDPRYEKLFAQNMKKHIDDVAEKYITQQTAPLAVLFVPAEGVYQYILSDCADLFDYSLRHHVMIAGPGTLTGLLTLLGQAQKDWYRAENMPAIEAGLETLLDEAGRLQERCEKAERTFASLSDQLHQSAVTSRKMRKKLDELLEGGDLP